MKLIVKEKEYEIYVEKDRKDGKVILVKIGDTWLKLTQDEAFGLYSDIWKAIAES